MTGTADSTRIARLSRLTRQRQAQLLVTIRELAGLQHHRLLWIHEGSTHPQSSRFRCFAVIWKISIFASSPEKFVNLFFFVLALGFGIENGGDFW